MQLFAMSASPCDDRRRLGQCLVPAGAAHRRGHFRLDGRARRNLPRIVAAAVGMGVLLAMQALPSAARWRGRRCSGRRSRRDRHRRAFFIAGLAFASGRDWRESRRAAVAATGLTESRQRH